MDFTGDPIGDMTQKVMIKCRDSIKDGANHQNRQNYNIVFEAIYSEIKRHQEALAEMNNRWCNRVERITELKGEIEQLQVELDKIKSERTKSQSWTNYHNISIAVEQYQKQIKQLQADEIKRMEK